jgi:hypothetical protein
LEWYQAANSFAAGGRLSSYKILTYTLFVYTFCLHILSIQNVIGKRSPILYSITMDMVHGVGSFRSLLRIGGYGEAHQSAMGRLCVVATVVAVLAWLIAVPPAYAADDPPDLTSQTVITEWVTDADEPYIITRTIWPDPVVVEQRSIITNTTTSGATWVIERRYTYGEISIVVVGMALCLLTAFDIISRLAMQRP